jgi:hypothetical protein
VDLRSPFKLTGYVNFITIFFLNINLDSILQQRNNQMSKTAQSDLMDENLEDKSNYENVK